MAADPLRVQVDEGIQTLTLNRPEQFNSITEPMARKLQQALSEAANDPAIRCMLLTGAGKAFCGGQDLPEVADKADDYDLGKTVRSSYNPVIKAIRSIEKPVVCAVNGTAAGAGANLAFACDIVVASSKAVFVQAFSNIGLIPDSGGTYFLPRLVGLQRANALYLLNEKLSPEKAAEMGLIHKTFTADSLMDEAAKICQKLAKMPTKGFGLYKRAINQSLQNNLEQQLTLEAQLQAQAGNTRDYKEGLNAFLEKRKPNFEGR